jgi:hypothetical protein
MSLCIIGAGVSGLLLILLLAETSFPLNTITIVDPHFDGGDLIRKWSSVMSNTPWSVTLESIQTHLPSVNIPKWALELPLDKPTPVSTIARLIRDCAKTVLDKVERIHGTVDHINWTSTTSTWSITVKKEQMFHTFVKKALCLTHGSLPKELDSSIPSIPLEVALDKNRLATYIKPTDKVIVFGTRHSGIYALKNLIDCSANTVGVYKDSKPFVFARDGVYDGLKLEGAGIADDINAGKYPVQMIALSNISNILREVRSADWAVYAIGFESRQIDISVDSVSLIGKSDYDINGKFINYPNAWGFGIAYPSQAPDGIHWDVGVSSFLEHIHRQIPSIISLI